VAQLYPRAIRVRVTLRLTVIQWVGLGVEPTLWIFDQILLPFQELGSGICCPVSVGRPLWWEAGSVLCKSQSSHLSVCTFTIYICVFHIFTIYIWVMSSVYSLSTDQIQTTTSCSSSVVLSLLGCCLAIPLDSLAKFFFVETPFYLQSIYIYIYIYIYIFSKLVWGLGVTAWWMTLISALP
jgi:hypothetical protein